MHKHQAQTLLVLVETKNQYVCKIRDITKRQKEFIAEENMEVLFQSIDEKDVYIKAIDRLDDELAPLYRDIQVSYENNQLDNNQGSLYKRLDILLQQIHSILEETYKLDRANMEKLKAMQGEYAENIKRINRGTKRQKAYNLYSPIDGGIFIDQKQ